MKTLLAVLSEKCNLNCSYCGVDKWSKKRIDADLYLEEFKKLREQFPTEKIKIDFFGGEPLLQMDLIEYIIDNIKDDNIKYFMPTNALLLTDEIVNFLNEKNIEISISFDGLWQDKNRLQLNGKGTLDRFLEKKHLFKKLNNVKCHTMISRGCYNLLENHLFIKNEFGFNSEFTLVRDVGLWNKSSIEKLKMGIKELFDWYENNTNEEMPFLILFYLRHFLEYHDKGHITQFCGAGKDIFMFSDNKVVPCTRFKDSPEMIEKIPKFINMEKCQSCEVKYYCRKGCLFEQIKNQGPIEELCVAYKYIYSLVGKMSSKLKSDLHFRKIIKEELING
jgi:uncharacterized protein